MRNNDGFFSVDTIIAIVAIFVFSSLIISLMFNNAIENIKIRTEALAIIYLTETLENIGIALYDNIPITAEDDSITYDNIIPKDLPQNYEMNIEVVECSVSTELPKEEDIIKKVTATISYTVGNKDYSLSMGRIKARVYKNSTQIKE